MDFKLTPEQGMLQDSLRTLLTRDYGFESRRARVGTEQGYSDATWAQFAELGLLGLAIPEADGGLGGDAFDTMVVMELLGRALVVEPYLSTVVLGARTLATAGSEAQKQEWLPDIMGGEKKLAFAHGEAAARYDPAFVETAARRQGDGWVLDGAKAVVRDALAADAILVSARTAGDKAAKDGLSLFLVDATAKGLSRRGYVTQDGGRAAEVTLKGVEVRNDSLVGAAGEAFPVIEQAIDRANAALCAEALGIIEALNAATLEYLKTRQQFGQPIGRFQALQHRMVDMTIKAVEARSMAIVAAAGAEEKDARERRRAHQHRLVAGNRGLRTEDVHALCARDAWHPLQRQRADALRGQLLDQVTRRLRIEHADQRDAGGQQRHLVGEGTLHLRDDVGTSHGGGGAVGNRGTRGDIGGVGVEGAGAGAGLDHDRRAGLHQLGDILRHQRNALFTVGALGQNGNTHEIRRKGAWGQTEYRGPVRR